jgi:hypothetical protein
MGGSDTPRTKTASTWTSTREIDRRLTQELLDRFVRAGAQYVYVDPRLKLRGPPDVVIPLRHHEDHMHVRIRPGAPAVPPPPAGLQRIG